MDVLIQDDSLAPHYQIVLIFSTYFPKGVGDEELNAVMEELSLMGSLEGVKVRDIGAIVRSSRGQVLFKIGISVVMGGIILVGIYCCYCLCSQNIWDLIRPRWRTSSSHGVGADFPRGMGDGNSVFKRVPWGEANKGGKSDIAS